MRLAILTAFVLAVSVTTGCAHHRNNGCDAVDCCDTGCCTEQQWGGYTPSTIQYDGHAMPTENPSIAPVPVSE